MMGPRNLVQFYHYSLRENAPARNVASSTTVSITRSNRSGLLLATVASTIATNSRASSRVSGDDPSPSSIRTRSRVSRSTKSRCLTLSSYVIFQTSPSQYQSHKPQVEIFRPWSYPPPSLLTSYTVWGAVKFPRSPTNRPNATRHLRSAHVSKSEDAL